MDNKTTRERRKACREKHKRGGRWVKVCATILGIAVCALLLYFLGTVVGKGLSCVL